MFFGTFVLLNLIVAVILEHFSALGNVNPDLVSASDIADFGDNWSVIWTENVSLMANLKGTMPKMTELDRTSLEKLLLATPAPLGVQAMTDEAGARRVVDKLDLPFSAEGYIDFQTVVDYLVRRSFQENLNVSETGDEWTNDRPQRPFSPQPSKEALLEQAPPPQLSPDTGLTHWETAEYQRLRSAAQRAANHAGETSAEVVRLQRDLDGTREAARRAESELRQQIGHLEGRLHQAETRAEQEGGAYRYVNERVEQLQAAHAAAEAAAAEAAAAHAAAETAVARAAAGGPYIGQPTATRQQLGGSPGTATPNGRRMPSPNRLPPPPPSGSYYRNPGMPPSPLPPLPPGEATTGGTGGTGGYQPQSPGPAVLIRPGDRRRRLAVGILLIRRLACTTTMSSRGRSPGSRHSTGCKCVAAEGAEEEEEGACERAGSGDVAPQPGLAGQPRKWRRRQEAAGIRPTLLGRIVWILIIDE